jgi:hypothetical protein
MCVKTLLGVSHPSSYFLVSFFKNTPFCNQHQVFVINVFMLEHVDEKSLWISIFELVCVSMIYYIGIYKKGRRCGYTIFSTCLSLNEILQR